MTSTYSISGPWAAGTPEIALPTVDGGHFTGNGAEVQVSTRLGTITGFVITRRGSTPPTYDVGTSGNLATVHGTTASATYDWVAVGYGGG